MSSMLYAHCVTLVKVNLECYNINVCVLNGCLVVPALLLSVCGYKQTPFDSV